MQQKSQQSKAKPQTPVDNVDNSTPATPVKPKLTIRNKKFIAGKVAGKTNHQAYLDAGYRATSNDVARANSAKLLAKENIKLAIEQALESQGATPEFAVGVLKQVADQTAEVGARRLAAKDILELHGWRRGDKPQVTLDIQNVQFFGARRNPQEVIDQLDDD